MKITVSVGQSKFRVDTAVSHSLAIPMNFNGSQPNHFGVERSSQKVVEVGEFVGDTTRGGSCNVDSLSLVPHCNGTHTETVEHIVDQQVPLCERIIDAMLSAQLVSITPVAAKDTDEEYRPALDHHDTLVTAKLLKAATSDADLSEIRALVVRTLPNSADKKTVAYGNPDFPAFLTVDAMEWIVENGFQHIVLDLPSVDKMYDEGLLTNHHLFWNVAEGSHKLTVDVRVQQTITEMAFVPDDAVDGMYLLSLQFPAFVADAAPSRPILFPVESE